MNTFFNRLYRLLFCRGGHGVHSPFVFDLITTVIEEQRHYYCYKQIHSVRLQLLQDQQKVMLRNRLMSIKKAIATDCFTESEDRLLFRLSNRFRPKTIYVEGSRFGLTPLYLTSYAKDSACIVIEPEPTIAVVAREQLKKYAWASVEIYSEAIALPPQLDFIVWGASFHTNKSGASALLSDEKRNEKALTMANFERFLSSIGEHSIMVITGINASIANKKVWNALCTHSKVTVTFDFYRFGIVFFNPRYHQKTYKTIV